MTSPFSLGDIHYGKKEIVGEEEALQFLPPVKRGWVGPLVSPFHWGDKEREETETQKSFSQKSVFLDQMASSRTISALAELTTPVTPKGEKRSFALRKVSICLLFFSRSILSQTISSA